MWLIAVNAGKVTKLIKPYYEPLTLVVFLSQSIDIGKPCSLSISPYAKNSSNSK